ncbi:uncharacterized protein Dwil_GK25135 [Drosophila willistoni]|uniref:Uncharacterized protein n=1 Tax=Drosophila willistoni TaxID=7260 RepID=B4NC71_DROWI|nr:uncharacterized protein LOC6648501 [Drosophila willistoni]EDW82430.1 uncharacterized protein Dwil_GK25135 [Drosophila willistoni]
MSLCFIVVASLLTIPGNTLALPSPPVQLEQHMNNAYGPAIHISSGVLQLAPPDEQTQLLLMPSLYPTPPHPIWSQIYLDNLPTSPILPTRESQHISISDNVDFPSRHVNLNELKLTLAQHQLDQLKPHSHGR